MLSSCACPFCKINMFLLSNLSNMIIDSATRWVDSWWIVGYVIIGFVVSGFIKTHEKHVWGGDFACALWSRFVLLF